MNHSASPEVQSIIPIARRLAYLRKFARRTSRSEYWAARDAQQLALPDLCASKLGCGHFGEAWSIDGFDDVVVKISGPGRWAWTERECSTYMRAGHRNHDYWAEWMDISVRNQDYPIIPKVLHFERLSAGVQWALLPKYEFNFNAAELAHRTRVHVDHALYNMRQGAFRPMAPWAWDAIKLVHTTDATLDLHGGNIGWDAANNCAVITDLLA